MPVDRPSDVTSLLQEWTSGDQDALERLLPLVYDELRRLAGHYLRSERPDHTLQATALVHEAYLRLIDQKNVRWQNRAHFFGIASQMMRRILVDHARKRHAAKRDAAVCRLSVAEDLVPAPEREPDILALDEAISSLSALDPQQGRIIELRFFGGLTVEETSEVVGVSPATVKREWATARLWLRHEMLKDSKKQRQA
jgi:RNA polymerase sigma factor (TIGR02999 family)